MWTWIKDQLRPRRPQVPPFVTSFPPPYRRVVAINSDVEFTSWTMQLALLGAFADRGLETAFSYWFFGDPEVTWHLFDPASLETTKFGRAAMPLLKAGLLDTVHSFGGIINGRGVYFDRAMIEQGYKRLADANIVPLVYSNHGTIFDTQNIGGDWVDLPGYPNYMEGDVVGSIRYHLDLTVRSGVRYFWLDIDRARAPLSFLPTAGEEQDCLFVAQVARDGTPILRFRRTDAMLDPDGATLGDALKRVLEASDNGYSIIYTHLGVKRLDDGKPAAQTFEQLPKGVLEGLDALAADQCAGRTLVTTTARALNHALMSAVKPWTIEQRGRAINVYLSSRFDYCGVPFTFDWSDYMGFSLAVDQHARVWLHLGSERRSAQIWMCGGQRYAGIPWTPIEMSKLIKEAALATAP